MRGGGGGGCGGGGYSDIFIHTWVIFGVQNFESHYLFFFWGGEGGFRKINFWGVWRFCGYFLGVITKLDYTQGSFLCTLGPFLKVKLQNGRYFWAAKILNIFKGACNSWFFFLWNVDAGPEPMYEKKIRVTPPPPPPGIRASLFKYPKLL